jgi:hypothetical protein
LGVIQRGQKVDPFDRAALGMIVVPADDVVFIGIGLFNNTIVENEHTIVLLDGPHMWLDCPPQIARCAFCAS